MWIRVFSHVVHLVLRGVGMDSSGLAHSLVPFHGLSPVVKSLDATFVVIPSLQIFNLALSFPLLDDLRAIAQCDVRSSDGSDRLLTIAQPSSPPTFYGSLDLSIEGGLGTIARGLLSLPGGIHFRKLTLRCTEVESSLATALVEECSSTLESLTITSYYIGIHSFDVCAHYDGLLPLLDGTNFAPINLSTAKRLEEVTFVCGGMDVAWVVAALQSVTLNHRNLQQISVHPFPDPGRFYLYLADMRRATAEGIDGQWFELDHLLAQLWESYSIRPNILYYHPPLGENGEGLRTWLVDLLPETMSRGIADLVRQSL